MSDLIRREDAIEAINKALDRETLLYGLVRKIAVDAIKITPSADRPQGEWIYGEHDVAMCDGYRCDRCGFFVPWDYEHKSIDFIKDYKFCPSCGARMKGADNE